MSCALCSARNALGFAGLTVAGLQPDDDSTIYDRVALGTTPCPTQHNASTLLKDDGDADSGQECEHACLSACIL